MANDRTSDSLMAHMRTLVCSWEFLARFSHWSDAVTSVLRLDAMTRPSLTAAAMSGKLGETGYLRFPRKRWCRFVRTSTTGHA